MTAARFAALRATEFPWSRDHVYLNAASIGPLPERTRRALEAFGHKRAAPQHLPDSDLQAVLRRARESVARLIGAEAGEIALATNTSYGLNLAASALPLGRGDVVVLSDGEFPANVYPWLALRDRGVEVDLVPTTTAGWPDEARLLERVRDPQVKVFAVSHVQFATGYRVDLDRLGAACRDADTFLVVDAIQALGQVPFDVRETSVDVLACGGQKWLLSPWGAGFTYVRRELVTALRPPFAGWMAFEGTDDFSRLTDYADRYRRDARRFEVGTIPFQDVVGMTNSIELLLQVGIESVRDHARAVLAPVYAAAERGELELASPTDQAQRSAITCIRTPRVEAAYRDLRQNGVTCSLREGAIRLSPHCYNTVEELERVVGIVRRRG
ncbi:MAG: aminotransferase class V-fold PLP-dependent enzyme [Gemmatimonadales bacterium]|jgi:selenocysteine lyase/cysteine desulfurase